MKTLALNLLFFFLTLASYSQVKDTAEVLFSAKLNVVSFGTVLFDQEKLAKLPLILEDTLLCKAKLIKSAGFSNVLFVNISIADDNISEILRHPADSMLSHSFDTSEIYYSDFILAYYQNANKFYKIKGFVENEFDIFYYEYSMSSHFWEKELLKNKKKFLSAYTIEGVDLGCLYRHIHSKRKPSLKKCPCLEPNPSRVIFIHGLPFYD